MPTTTTATTTKITLSPTETTCHVLQHPRET